MRCSMKLAAIRVHTWFPRALQTTKNIIEYNNLNASLAASSSKCVATCSFAGIDLPARYQGPISTDPRILATSCPSSPSQYSTAFFAASCTMNRASGVCSNVVRTPVLPESG